MPPSFEANLERIRERRAFDINATSTPPAGAMFAPRSFINTQLPQADQFPAENAINNAYLAELYTYRCIQSITRSITGQSFRAGPDPEKPGAWNQHGALSMLLSKDAKGSPNPFWSSSQLLKYALGQYVLTGKTAWLKDRDKVTGKDQLWPLMVQVLKPMPTGPTGSGYFSGFEYGQRGTPNFRKLTNDQVVYLWNPSLADVRQPESVMQSGQINISVNRMLALYDYHFLKNNATPSTLVVTPPFAEASQKRAFQDQFIAQYGGYNNAGRTVFAEVEDGDFAGQAGNTGAVSVMRIGSTGKEAEMRQMMDDYINSVCLMWGVPRSVLTDSTGAKYTNMANDRKNYWLETLQPLASEFADQINTHMAPELGSDLGWFDLSGVPELQTESLSVAVTGLDLVLNKVIKLDELRAAYGLPPAAEVGLDPDEVGVDVAAAQIISKTNPEPVTDMQKKPGDPASSAAGGPDPVELPAAAPEKPKLSVVRSADMLERAAQRREEIRARGTLATVWRTHHIAGSPDSPCPICKPLEGQINNGKKPVIDTHPNCDCTNDVQRVINPGRRRDAAQSETRHKGPEGHQHVPSGHVTMNVLKRMLSANMATLLADQQAESSKRLGGQRGQKMAREARADAHRLYDREYWGRKMTATLEPVFGETRAALWAAQYNGSVLAALGQAGTLLPDVVDSILVGSMAAFIKQVEADLAFPSEESA